LFGQFAEASMSFLDRKGIQLTPEGLAKFIHAVAEAVVQGDEHLLRNAGMSRGMLKMEERRCSP
jgi:hypothetical protein